MAQSVQLLKSALFIIISFFLLIASIRAQNPIDLTLLPPSSMLRGAVCLDGSLPGYHLDRGHGTGENSWIIHLEGGGWCSSVKDCLFRSHTARGSSSFMAPLTFQGHLSNSSLINPGFYNWNRVLVRYCDGASFSGNVDTPTLVTLSSIPASHPIFHQLHTSTAQGRFRTRILLQGSTKVFFRGQRIWEAVMDELLNNQGMLQATQAILSGDSAGGLATFHHCNDFKLKMPPNAVVKCLSDGGFFLDVPTITGEDAIKSLYENVTTLHNVTILPRACTALKDSGECFFPQNNLNSINVPLFFLQSSYDSWQLRNVIAPASADPSHNWSVCTTSLSGCSSSQLNVLQDFRKTLVNTLEPLRGQRAWGMHIVSCLHHTEELFNYLWNGFTRVNKMTAVEAFTRWYFEDELVQNIDCEFPCNDTCN